MECRACGYFMKSTDVYCPRCQKLKETAAAAPAAAPAPQPYQQPYQQPYAAPQPYPQQPAHPQQPYPDQQVYYQQQPAVSPQASALHIVAIVMMSIAAAVDLILLVVGGLGLLVVTTITSALHTSSDEAPKALFFFFLLTALIRGTGFVLYLTRRSVCVFFYPIGCFFAFLLPIIASASDDSSMGIMGAVWLILSLVLGGFVGYAYWQQKETFI